jgi:hypothetical protein
MPSAINTVTGIIREYPMNIIDHRVLGRNLKLYVPSKIDDDVEEDKVVFAKKVYTKKSETPVEDANHTKESTVTKVFKDGE